jgi:hypothetical protein
MIIRLLNIKSDLPKLLCFSVGAIILILLISTLATNEVYGQISPNTRNNSVAQPPSQQQPHPPSQKIHVVKITTPAKGQQVVAGKNLIVSGTSVDNTTSDCGVSVIVNGVKPYRLASANGSAGPKDFSKWNFTLTPAYTSIKLGQNKITAKFSCANDPNLISHSSVNVTGVGTSLAPIANQQKQQYSGKNSTTTKVNTTSTGNAISRVNSSSSSSSSVANTNNNNTNSRSAMSVSIHLAKKSVQPGDKQSVIIKVTDFNSTSPVAGASVMGRVTDPSGGPFKKLEGTTDDTGKSSYSWTVSQGDTPGKYKTTIEVSAYGYKNNTSSKTFQVIPVTTTTTGNNSLIQPVSPNANNSHNNQKNSPSTIIPIPHIRIPTIKIPFHLPFQ